MGLYKRGQVWWIRFSYQGKRIRKSTETSDKALAKRVYDKILGEVAERKWFEQSPGEDKTVAELLDKYLNDYALSHKSPGTIEWNRVIIQELKEFFKDKMIRDLTPEHILRYKMQCKGRGLAPATVNHRLGLLRHAFNLAMKEWDWARENPAAKVGRERVRNARDRWLTFDEESRLLKACLSRPKNTSLKKAPVKGIWLKEIILFALNTGMRQDEILSLAWSEVDLLRRTVTVLKSKNGEKRTIPLNQKMTDLLKKKGSVRRADSSFVFPSLSGTKIIRRNLLRAFYASVERAGITGFRFHDLRHTFATRLVQAGVDLYKVAKLLGHKDIRMTQRYAHHYPESLRDGVEVLDRLGTKGAQSNREGVQTSEGGGTKLAHSNKKELTAAG